MSQKNTKTNEDVIVELSEEVGRLKDENESLWLMIDEIWASDITKFADIMQKAHNEILLDRYMLQASELFKA